MRNLYGLMCLLFLSFCAQAQVPTATIGDLSSAFCTNKGIAFVARTNDTVTYSWLLRPSNSATFIAGNPDSLVAFRVANAGTYTLYVTVTNAAGSATVTKTFNVSRSAKASFNASISNQGYPAELMLTDYSTNSLKHYWVYDGNTLDKDSAATVTKKYTVSGNYKVTLIAKGINGCDDSDAYSFRIADSSGMTLPNVFSPNGDGVNDIFKPVARGMAKLSAWIYNRSGVVIYSWENRISGFWDGYTTGGEPCIAGEYFVIVEATGFDGKTYKLKSNITLVR